MASGKTTIGKLLAFSLNSDFVDTDQLIEKTEGIEISHIFNLKGENYFRKKEKQILENLMNIEGTVISTGGGLVLDPDNKKRLRDIGTVVYLVASPDWILSNLNRGTTIRPLLQNEKYPIIKIRELLKIRERHYEEVADFKVIVDNKSLHEIIDNIISLI